MASKVGRLRVKVPPNSKVKNEPGTSGRGWAGLWPGRKQPAAPALQDRYLRTASDEALGLDMALTEAMSAALQAEDFETSPQPAVAADAGLATRQWADAPPPAGTQRADDRGLALGDATLGVHSLGKSYGGRQVVKDVSIHVRRGEAVGLLGPNGAGKTTVF
jgi:ABC-type multidrug transport system fused ATPase/permease subunit